MANDKNIPGDPAKKAKDALGKLPGNPAEKAAGKAGDLAAGAAGKAGNLASGATGKAGDLAAGATGKVGKLAGGAATGAAGVAGGLAGGVKGVGKTIGGAADGIDPKLPGKPSMNASMSGGSRSGGRSMWIEKSASGKRPLASSARWGLGALTFGALGIGSALWGIDHIEDDLEDAVIEEVFEEYGVRLSKDQVDFDGRSGDIVDMDLPPGVSTGDVEAMLKDNVARGTDRQEELRTINVTGTPAVVVEEEPPPPTTAAPEVVAATGPLDVQVSTDGESITLNGEVLNQDQHDSLVNAANDAVGAANVTNNLTITGLDEQEPGADAKVTDMAVLFAGVNGLVEGSGTVTDSALNFTGIAKDAEGEALIEGLAGSANATTSVDVSVAEVTVEQEVELLQAELDALQAEILENVVFDVNSDAITPTAAATLDKVVAAMTKYQRPVVAVDGHTDSDGNDGFNLDLSDRRAKSVSAYLVNQGIAAERLVGTGFGETEPIAPNDTAENKQANRRVVFTAKSEFAS